MNRPQEIYLKVCNVTIGEETHISIDENAIQHYKKVKLGYVFEVDKFGRLLTIATGDTKYEIEIRRIKAAVSAEPTYKKLFRILGFID